MANLLLFYGSGHVVNSAGGATKVLCNMANEMTRRGHTVTILCNDIVPERPFYPLDGNVKFINLGGAGRDKTKYPQRLKIYRELTRPLRRTALYPLFSDPIAALQAKEICLPLGEVIAAVRPDVVISYFIQDHYHVVHAMQEKDCPSCPCILMHHGHPRCNFLELPKATLASLRYCDCLQVLLPNYKKTVHTALPYLKTAVIPNAVPLADDYASANTGTEKEEYVITMIARVEKNKQQHFLIEAFSRLAKSYPQWTVRFYGGEYDKKYAAYLKPLIRQRGLEHQVFLMGTTDKPLDVLSASDIFAFPSAFEGFPLALTEAMSVGLPCVGLKTAPGVNELIVDSKNGFLAENNVADFAAKLKLLMDNPSLRATLGQNGRTFVKQFEPQKIWDQWENLITETVGQYKKRNAA